MLSFSFVCESASCSASAVSSPDRKCASSMPAHGTRYRPFLYNGPFGRGRRVYPASDLVVRYERRPRRELRRELALKVQVVLERARRPPCPLPLCSAYMPDASFQNFTLRRCGLHLPSSVHRYDAWCGARNAVRVQVLSEKAVPYPPRRDRALLPAKAPPCPVPGILRGKRGRAAGRPKALRADPDKRRPERASRPFLARGLPPRPSQADGASGYPPSAMRLSPIFLLAESAHESYCPGPSDPLPVDLHVAAPPAPPDDHRRRRGLLWERAPSPRSQNDTPPP